MKNCYLFLLLLLAGRVSAQGSCTPVTGLSISNVTATTATLTFGLYPPGYTNTASALVSYAYTTGAPIPVSDRVSPVVLTGLRPASQVTVQIIRQCTDQLGAPLPSSPSVPVTLTFSTASGALAARAGTADGTLGLAPNPARGIAALTLAAPLPQPALVYVFDALGRAVRQQPLPAHATRAELDVAGLPAGLYVVRCAAASARLAVE